MTPACLPYSVADCGPATWLESVVRICAMHSTPLNTWETLTSVTMPEGMRACRCCVQGWNTLPANYRSCGKYTRTLCPLSSCCQALHEMKGHYGTWDKTDFFPESLIPHRLAECHLTDACCGVLACVLNRNENLTLLDLSGNDLKDFGVQMLCDTLIHPICKLQTF